jgi:hypothetical protein
VNSLVVESVETILAFFVNYLNEVVFFQNIKDLIQGNLLQLSNLKRSWADFAVN